MKYYLVYSEKHAGYGLFDDLKKNKDVKHVVPKQLGKKNKLTSLLRNIHLSSTITRYVNLPLKNLWYEKPSFNFKEGEEYCVVIVDLALIAFSKSELDSLVNQKNVRCVLVLVNSMDSDTMRELGLKERIQKTKWDDVYTYDDKDVKKYHYKSIEYAYTSLHPLHQQNEHRSDAYFIGTLKPSRQKQILSVYKKLKENGVIAEFHLMKLWRERDKDFPYADSIDYYTFLEKSIPYKEVLQGDTHTNTLIEILQDNQGGPSLRYYEAVVFNKKLLTNNSNIVGFPFYNERFMKIFETAEDIDTEWVKAEDDVEYGYTNEFSCKRLPEIVLQ